MYRVVYREHIRQLESVLKQTPAFHTVANQKFFCDLELWRVPLTR